MSCMGGGGAVRTEAKEIFGGGTWPGSGGAVGSTAMRPTVGLGVGLGFRRQ